MTVTDFPYMYAKLVAYTQPVDTTMDMQALIAYCARVSNQKNQHNHLTAGKLLMYMRNHNHWSPFEMANLVIEINTTRDIARQILRHRSFSFQEFSQRYAEYTEPMITREARLQDEKNRQSSIDVDDSDLLTQWHIHQKSVSHYARKAYEWAIENGIAKEVARTVLPEGMTLSRMYVNGTVRSWLHYCHVRCNMDTQKEHRLIASECYQILIEKVPALQEVSL
jgi:thymidylate synthase (FAD)